MSRKTIKLVHSSCCIEHHDRPVDEWHHVVPYIKGGTVAVPLCQECHAKVHGNQRTNPMSTSVLVRLGLERAKKDKILLGRPKHQKHSEIIKLYKRGWSHAAIRIKLKIGYDTIKTIIRRWRLENRKRGKD